MPIRILTLYYCHIESDDIRFRLWPCVTDRHTYIFDVQINWERLFDSNIKTILYKAVLVQDVTGTNPEMSNVSVKRLVKHPFSHFKIFNKLDKVCIIVARWLHPHPHSHSSDWRGIFQYTRHSVIRTLPNLWVSLRTPRGMDVNSMTLRI